MSLTRTIRFHSDRSATNNTINQNKPDERILSEASQQGDELHLDLWYPRNEDSPTKSLVIGLMDVRASDDIRVSYDFERDGWKVEQASTFSWEIDDKVCDPDWQEVAFVRAWGRQKNDDQIG